MKMHRRTFLKHTTVASGGIYLAATGLVGAGSMLRAGYRGWISLEFQGREDSSTGVPQSLEVLREHFSA